MIPNQLHYVFGLKENFGNRPFSFLHYLAIRSAIVFQKPDAVNFHYKHEPEGIWWERLKPDLQTRLIELPELCLERGMQHYAHQSDVIRLEKLHEEGGIYLDIDTVVLKPFHDLLESKTSVLGIEPGNGLGNAVILAPPGDEFILRWLDEYRFFNDRIWNRFSIEIPYQIALRHPTSVMTLPETAFFFPAPSDPNFGGLIKEDYFFPRRGAFQHLLETCSLSQVRSRLSFLLSRDLPPRRPPLPLHLRSVLGGKTHQTARLRDSFTVHLCSTQRWDAHLRDLGPDDILEGSGSLAAILRERLGEEWDSDPLQIA